MPYLSKEQIAAAREMDLLTYLRRFDPEEILHREMVLVVAEHRRHNCAGLSDNGGGYFFFGCRSAHSRRTAPCAAQIRANRTTPEN